jgi:hypothetical protein
VNAERYEKLPQCPTGGIFMKIRSSVNALIIRDNRVLTIKNKKKRQLNTSYLVEGRSLANHYWKPFNVKSEKKSDQAL